MYLNLISTDPCKALTPLVKRATHTPSWETQGQSVGSGKMAGRKFSSKGGGTPLVLTLTELFPKI